MAKTKQLLKPCDDCAFRRSSTPGNLGGSEAEVYIGQTHGPFWIPCHCSKEYRCKQAQFGDEAECVGSAVFRANIGRADLMPPALLKLPPDHENVFSTPAEFVAHHQGITIEQAEAMLKQTPPEALFQIEIGRKEVRHDIAR